MYRALRPLRLPRTAPTNDVPTMRSASRGPRSTSAPSLRRQAIVVAVIACCTTGGTGFLGPAPPLGSSSLAGSFRRRCPAGSHGGDSSSSSSSRALYSQDKGSRHSCRSGVGNRRGEGGRDVLMATSGGMGPGKGTQVVLLRHGMSTFNKLNIFTVSQPGVLSLAWVLGWVMTYKQHHLHTINILIVVKTFISWMTCTGYRTTAAVAGTLLFCMCHCNCTHSFVPVKLSFLTGSPCLPYT